MEEVGKSYGLSNADEFNYLIDSLNFVNFLGGCISGLGGEGQFGYSNGSENIFLINDEGGYGVHVFASTHDEVGNLVRSLRDISRLELPETVG